MNVPILVTGATGNVGRALVGRLQEKGANLTAAVNHPAKAAWFEQQGTAAATIDFADTGSLIRAMDGVERVFLLVPFGQTMSAWTENAVAAARAAGVKHLVRLSGFGADPGSDCLLNRIQGTIDRMVEDSGIVYSLLRPNAFMQNFVVYYGGMIRNQSSFYLPDGDGRTSFVDVRDIAAVAAEVLTNPVTYENKAFEITGPEALSDAEAAKIISTATGRAVTYHPIDESAAREAMLGAGMPAWNVAVLLSLSAFVRAGKAAAVSTTVHEVTGHEPITFEQFARDYRSAWKHEG